MSPQTLRAAYDELAAEPGSLVMLSRLRARLGDVPRGDLDRVLLDLEAQRIVHLEPESNQKVLTQADRDAAIWLGVQHVHAVKFLPQSAASVRPQQRARARKPNAGDTVEWTSADGEILRGQVVSANTSSMRIAWEKSGRVEHVRLNDPSIKVASANPGSAAADGLDALEDRQLRSLATEWEQPTTGSRAQLIKRLRAAGATSPQVRQAQTAAAQRQPMTPQRLAQGQRDARQVIGDAATPGEWLRLPAVREGLTARGYSVDEQDEIIGKLALDRDVRVIPVANLKSLTEEDRRAAIHLGGEQKHAIMIERSPGGAPRGGRAAQRLGSTRSSGDDLEALRDQLRATTDADRRDTLVQRIVQLSDAGKADQPREVTRDQIQQAYAELADHPGELVSLARLRDRLKHVKHTELTAALKEMDRQRLLQLDPDPNRKALPAEAHEAAVRLGDEDKHFLSIAGVGGSKGRAAQRLRRS